MKILQNKRIIIAGVVGLLLGALIILGIRFVTYKPEVVHYHANFAVYVNGVKEQFKALKYYEETEVTACTLEPVDSPKERAHMHGNVNDVVHVEDHLVTWSHFMQNLGWSLGDDYLKTADAIYPVSEQKKLVFILNGKPVENIADQIIQDKDKLLISYGTATSSQLQEQYKSIPATAGTYDTSKDPAGCGAGGEVKMSDRIRNLF
jgi:hypothetical protein